MVRVTKLVFALLSVVYFAGCSSTQENPETREPEVQVSEEEKKSRPEVSVTQPETMPDVAPEPPPEPTTKAASRKLDPRYDSLVKAVRKSGKASEIQEEASRLLGADANDAVALNTIALLHLRRGQPKAAKLLLARAIEKSPSVAGLHNNLGVAHLDDGDPEAAIVEFKKALDLDEGHVEALGNLGSLYLKGGNVNRAFPLLEAAYRANRSNAAVANNYALALRARNELEAARRVYADLLKTHPKDVNALLNYAILLIEFMNQPKEGLELVYKVKFLETQRKDVLATANALENKAKSELK